MQVGQGGGFYLFLMLGLVSKKVLEGHTAIASFHKALQLFVPLVIHPCLERFFRNALTA